MTSFDLTILIKYIRTTISEVRKSAKGEYTFFWHDVSKVAWNHYINTDVIDSSRPNSKGYDRDTWQAITQKNYWDTLKYRKRVQVLLAFDFLGLKMPSPQSLAHIGKRSWLEFLRDHIAKKTK